MIEQPDTQDYDELLRIWELAVRSTHHFLTENDILFYKHLVRDEYFQAVELYMLRGSTGRIAAFLGLSEDNIEMLSFASSSLILARSFNKLSAASIAACTSLKASSE